MYTIDDYDYELPEALIAQVPAKERSKSRLLCLGREDGGVSHHLFDDICDFLRPSDLLVINNTKVIPGRLLGKKETGGKVEVLILDFHTQNKASCSEKPPVFTCMVKASKRLRPGMHLFFDQGLRAEVLGSDNGICSLSFHSIDTFDTILDKIGKVPLPPYITRPHNTSAIDDKKAYQTVYAEKKGAIAAPTAGLHFSDNLMDRIREGGVTIAAVTLHVGYGTFSPVRVKDIRTHKMHSEWFSIPKETAHLINHAKQEGNRIIAVGTTSVRTLEYAADPCGTIRPAQGNCDLFIYPGFTFKVVDAMITNFHLPKSTLMMLVSAFAGRGHIMNAYKAAVSENYRFFSYGDSMFIA